MKTVQDCSRWREAILIWVGEGFEGEQHAQLQDHFAACPDCRDYARKLRAATIGLRSLADRPVEPSPGFRGRWVQAVEDTTRPAGAGETAAALATWWRGLLLRNLRPALAVASVWILVLLFRLTAPDISPATQTTAARSPIEIVRALEADHPLLAWHLWKRALQPAPLPRPLAPQPRSEGSPAGPAAQSDSDPDAHATVEVIYPNLVARGNSPALPLV
jgi:hypothetical protein